MSDMYKDLDFQNVGAVNNFLLSPKSSDPGSPTEGAPFFNTTDDRIKIQAGGSLQTVAWLSDAKASDTQTLSSLSASTPTDVTPTGLSNISAYTITRDSDNLDISFGLFVVVDQATPKITITSLLALTDLTIEFIGDAS